MLWAVFEKSILEWCGEERKTNHFCLSFRDTEQVVEAWLSFLTGQGTGAIGGRNLKYSALNVGPVLDRGSFEFRCGKAADKASDAISFALLCYYIVDYACTKFKDPRLLASVLSEHGAFPLLRDIFSKGDNKYLTDEMFNIIVGQDVAVFERDCMEGFRTVQALAYRPNWTILLKEIDRPFVPNPFSTKSKKSSIRINSSIATPRIEVMPERGIEATTAQPRQNFRGIPPHLLDTRDFVEGINDRVPLNEAPRYVSYHDAGFRGGPASMEAIPHGSSLRIFTWQYNWDSQRGVFVLA
jgi:hypothetical protein